MDLPYMQSPGVARLVRSVDEELALEQKQEPLPLTVQAMDDGSPWNNLLKNRRALIVGALLGGFFTLGLCCLIVGIASR